MSSGAANESTTELIQKKTQCMVFVSTYTFVRTPLIFMMLPFPKR